MALGLHNFHDALDIFPPGLGALGDKRDMRSSHYLTPTSPPNLRVRSWMVYILPYVEQDALYKKLPLRPENARDSATFSVPTYPNDGTNPGAHPLDVYTCPSDPRGVVTFTGTERFADTFANAGMTSYAGVGGIDAWGAEWPNAPGMLYWRSKTRITDVQDGTSNTLFIGERPPDPDRAYGWWQSADSYRIGQDFLEDWEWDTVQYITNTFFAPWDKNYNAPGQPDCPFPAFYGPGDLTNFCDFNHFWSLHSGGANFAFCDGSVRFIPYNARPVMNALSTRARGEVASLEGF
jgi:prepilin-type processing-associated H-X9-DG protein